MKKVLFTSTALAALAIGGMASAQGIALFGDARLGLGYNINNDGSVNGDEDLRAVSRVRFGVNMTGETDAGITFGATIRADNSQGGQGGSNGQTAGNVFVSGDWGTLTLGDTNGADEQWVGDIPGNFALTGFDDNHETLFLSNGGSVGSNDFAADPYARPTIRYDIDIAGFGLSLSSNRDLNSVGVGAGYAADFAGGSWKVGVGYYDYKAFEIGTDDTVGIEGGEVVVVPGTLTEIPDGHQWSGSIGGEYESFGFGVVYTNAESDGDDAFETLGVGGTFGFDAFTVGAYYQTFLNADGGLDALDGAEYYALTGEYDLGGGASINGGIGSTYDRTNDEQATVADFGVKMAF